MNDPVGTILSAVAFVASIGMILMGGVVAVIGQVPMTLPAAIALAVVGVISAAQSGCALYR